MKSMTGYGKAEATLGNRTITVELKSVNHRFLDVSVRLPSCLNFAEFEIRKCISKYCQRGHFDCFINYYVAGVSAQVKEYVINPTQIKKYLEIGENLKNEYNLSGSLEIKDILNLPSALMEKQSNEDQDMLLELLTAALEKALANLVEMRETEGNFLSSVLENHLSVIENLTNQVKEYAPEVVELYRNRLKARVQEYLGEVELDEARLLNEVAVYTDKVNIDEEINRMFSHIAQFKEYMASCEPQGKSLDHLIPEMMRESNTMCSKANNKNLLKCAIGIKNEIEKIREQVQNIE